MLPAFRDVAVSYSVSPSMTTADTVRDVRGSGRALVVCDQWLGSNGYAALKALRRTGWACEVVPEWEYVPVRWPTKHARLVSRAIRGLAVSEFNLALRSAAVRLAPDFLLVFKGTFVQRKTLEAIRASGIKTYCFYPDVSFRTHGKYLPHALPGYDWIFTTKSFGVKDLAEQLGVRTSSVLLHAFDADLHRPVTPSAADWERYNCDVSFIGTWSPKKEAMLAGLLERRPETSLRIFGDQWGRATSHRLLYRASAGFAVLGDEYARAIACSRINLGLLSERRPGASDGDQITSRSFHIPACGGFMLHERTHEVLALFEEGASIACFDGVEELASAVDTYLANETERARIAKAGYDLVVASHSWDHRIRDILSLHNRARS